ncbi:MAG: hypothetical protein WA634_11780 [Silvibacterium sp.]
MDKRSTPQSKRNLFPRPSSPWRINGRGASLLRFGRRYGIEPYRYKGQRYTTVMVRAPRSFVDHTLWPEYLELQAALHSYLNEATERIIREEVYADAGEAAERSG